MIGGTTLRVVVLAAAIAGVGAGCVERQLRAEFTRADQSLLRSPAMHLVVCGTGTALSDPRRAGPCTAIVAGGRFYLIDVGPGGWQGADLAGLPLAGLTGVFLTTFLADDVADLDEATMRSWIAGRTQRLQVYGPTGTADLVAHVGAVLRRDVVMRGERHDRKVLDPRFAGADAHEFAIADDERTALVLDENGLRVTAVSVGAVGGIPSVAYRFEYAGRSIVIGGHERKHPSVRTLATGADILVHEAAAPAMIERGMETMRALDRQRLVSFSQEMLHSHSSPIEVAELARDAGVGLVVLTRLYPPPNSMLERWAFLRGVRAVFPDVVLAEDGLRLRLDPR